MPTTASWVTTCDNQTSIIREGGVLMSKKKGSGFKNLASREFDEGNRKHLGQMSEKRIYKTLNSVDKESKDSDVTEMDLILDQYTKNRLPKGAGKKPKYAANIFMNVSGAKYVYEYTKANLKDLDKDQRKSLSLMLCDGYIASVSNKFGDAIKDQDRAARHEYILSAFIMINKKLYRKTKKLDLKRIQRAEICLQAYQELKFGIKYLCIKIDESTVPVKKKYKVFMDLYGKRDIKALGASLSTSSRGELVPYLFERLCKLSRRKLKKALKSYAEVYKKTLEFNYTLKCDDAFSSKKFKKITKSLIKSDEGYRKAFKAPKKRPSSKGAIEKKSFNKVGSSKDKRPNFNKSK